MEISEIRKLAGISRAEMCRKYGIPVRTAEDWENGRGNAPKYVRVLLERAIREDFFLPRIYRVYTKKDGCDDEWEILATANIQDALNRAKEEDYINKRDKNGFITEIRIYLEDIDSENCNCYDYDLIDF